MEYTTYTTSDDGIFNDSSLVFNNINLLGASTTNATGPELVIVLNDSIPIVTGFTYTDTAKLNGLDMPPLRFDYVAATLKNGERPDFNTLYFYKGNANAKLEFTEINSHQLKGTFSCNAINLTYPVDTIEITEGQFVIKRQ